MRRTLFLHRTLVPLLATCSLLAGCGTTKWSDSPRTATEQLLVSDAIDRAISEIDFSPLNGRNVYLDTRFIIAALDQNYVVSTLRQHMLASGCIIKDKAEDATYVVEVRSGTLGTNRQDLLFGVPATTLPTAGLLPVGAASIPEIALVKRTNQQGVCKIAVFAYDRMSGRPVWQSGNRKVASRAKDVWVAGAGPFQRGTIYDGTAFAGEKLAVPLVKGKTPAPSSSVGLEKLFIPGEPQFAQPATPVAPNGNSPGIENAGYLAPVNNGKPPTPLPAPAASPAAAPPSAATPPPANGAGANAAGGGATPPKAAYTPPPPPPAAAPPPPPPPPPPSGLQGNLTQQAILPPTANPAAATAGAIQTFNWAKDMLDRQKQ